MSEIKILDVHNREEFRNWLMENSQHKRECYLILKRGKPTHQNVFYYLDAVEEALCFGWIDSISKKYNDVTVQRFTPRKKNSPWTELNRERVKRLQKLGLMTRYGKKVLPKGRSKMDEDVIAALKEARCYKIFKSFHPLYQRVRVYNVAFYKNIDKTMYHKSLKHLIDETKKGKMYGEWNDYGRLLDY